VLILTTEDALALVYRAVDALNEQLAPADRLPASPETPLLGDTGTIDSVQLVNLIVATEELLLDVYDRSVSLADDRAFSRARSPFLTIGSLAGYVEERSRKDVVV
jgi:acyl carrier protein